ncbi:hypothetical protein AB0M02_43210 [Actinoplanes sp. NPDC051861]|uniref:hypothetical protein n=1 Tax=Actinoplanes sp. NPDC051861 TaxID=3155170 RepID=UPI00342AC2F4
MFFGDALDGRVRIELGDDGRLWDLTLDPRVTQLPVSELRAGLIAAFTRAQDSLLGSFAAPALEDGSEAVEIASRRFEEISSVLYDLSRQAVRKW